MLDRTHLTTCIRNARGAVQDALTHVYVMSEHQADRDRYKLGEGAFASSISLLATLNLLSKVHYILMFGESKVVGDSQLQAYDSAKNQIKNSPGIRWTEVKQFLRKPRIGEINESDAFVSFIHHCPVDFGLPRDDPTEVRRIWATFRNKLTHLIALANDVQSGQMLMSVNVQPSQPGLYEQNLRFIQSRIGTYKPFEIPAAETKAAFRDKENIAPNIRQMILNDKCHVERLAVAVDMTINWLIAAIENGTYSQENIGVLTKWLNGELSPQDSE